jgi:hypothetical protein
MVPGKELQISLSKGIKPLKASGMVQLAQAMQWAIGGVALIHRTRRKNLQQASAECLEG